MAKLLYFTSVTLDGCLASPTGDMGWAHENADDPEWSAFVNGNASGDSRLLFGRVTYDMMCSYWPTPMAAQNMPIVAKRMNSAPKVVFSRTMTEATWQNTRLIKADIVGEVRKLKADGGPDMAILGSDNVASQLAQAGLIDEFQIVVHPVVLGAGRKLFGSVTERLNLVLRNTRTFSVGRVVLYYEPRTPA